MGRYGGARSYEYRSPRAPEAMLVATWGCWPKLLWPCTWRAQEVSRAQLLQEVLRIWTQLSGCVQALLWLQVSHLPPLSPRLHNTCRTTQTHTHTCEWENAKYHFIFFQIKNTISIFKKKQIHT